MNLKELRQEVNAALDYNPDLAQYRDIVARVLNRHYLQISSQYQWSFLQKTHEITLKAKIEGGSGKTITVTDSTVAGLRTVSFGGVSAPTAESDWEGQTLKIGTVEAEITQVVTGDKVIIDTTLSGAVSASTDWSLEFRRYPVPKDCTEILGIMSRDDDRGRLVYVDRAREENLHLDRDETGDGIVYISMDSYIDPPPDDAPSASEAAGGSLETNTEYEFCYTFIYKGRESAPSLVVSHTTGTGVDRSVKIYDLENTQATYGGTPAENSTGRLKRIYARKKTSGGVWREISGDLDESTTAFTWDGTYSSSSSGEKERQRVPTLYEQGPRDYFRIWYTPNSDMNMDVRYLQQPRRLSNDADVPSWPAPYHHLLVYRTLQDICLQHGMTQLGQLYERRSGVVLEQMKARWLSSPDRLYIRRSFMKDILQFERWGTPSKL